MVGLGVKHGKTILAQNGLGLNLEMAVNGMRVGMFRPEPLPRHSVWVA